MQGFMQATFLARTTLLLMLLGAACSVSDDGRGVQPASSAASTQRSEGSGPALDRGTAFFTLGEHEVVINYGRPALAGRDMLSQMEPGQVWRLGMNEATELDTTSTLTFNGQTVPAGRYTIFARLVSEGQWELIFNSETGQWGAFEHDPELDVARIPLSTRSSDETVERLTISFERLSDAAGRLIIAWGDSELFADFQLS